MTTLKQAIDALVPIEGGWRGSVPETWLQGRTAYGGFSAALALHAAQVSDVDLPPLRSAQVSFIGPLSGDIAIRATRLRRGRNAAFVQVDVESDAGLGLRATFVFMGPVESRLDHHVGAAPEFPVPGPETTTYRGTAAVPFTQNFEFVDQRDGPKSEWLRWVRLAERDGLDPMVELMCIADCLPPAALKLIGAVVPISSMTWLFNVLGSQPLTRDGWWLLRATTDYAREGSSSQQMAIWNADGVGVGEQMQSVAVFG
ncbi:thioesterase family protein [Sphingomonas ginsenosidivorax]|uniref:Thioesterase family protein n=1 Tax=Sphingomonas ginsenosidivorax TaxID=862135 RepID=A0A5C6UAQ3_9SPHN|nr:thioesterase family protein [Sphingomonas ginsenosidivorax]TXC69804.1 thioesterase family protein [Sphingomonas ginsenosidivorax]